MGNVGSVLHDPAPLHLRDQTRFAIAGVTVCNARGQPLLRVSPNAFPATRYTAQRELGDDTPVEFIQDPESLSGGSPSFLLRITSIDEIIFNFTITLRQQSYSNGTPVSPTDHNSSTALDTQIAGLTFVFASSAKEVENLVVREFHSNPNLHKNPNVELLGDYSTGGSPSVQFTYTWKWRPPKLTEDRGGGWRNHCSFVEYNQRANRLDTLATFSFWVQSAPRLQPVPPKSPRLELGAPPRLRVPSSQSVESRASNVSDSEGEGSLKGDAMPKDVKDPQSPPFEPIPEDALGLVPAMSTASNPVKFDIATCKPSDDPSLNDDGPLFRATMRSLEQKTGNMRQRMKKVLRSAEAAEAAQHACNQAVSDFIEALREASTSNANAVKPALDHYFERIAREILLYEKQNSLNLHKLIIDPISRLYNIEIKQADFKKREFDEESKEYYAYVSKYLGQRSESLKEKKQKQSDEKYQAKRRTFELKRFDYSSFMHDLHGGRKDQEVLSHLTKYADAQARGYLATAKKVEEMLPQLDALISEVKSADQDFLLSRTEREEKRRLLEKSTKSTIDDVTGTSPAHGSSQTNGLRGETDLARSGAFTGLPTYSQSPPSVHSHTASNGMLGASAAATATMGASPNNNNNNRFKGIRDLEDNSGATINGGTYRKEGLLWALSRPGSHADPKGITKAAWHKFWIVLDQGRLAEYVNWKDKLDLHIDPIDLRVASVREARSTERRFCFEVITPQFTRVYQAPSEDDMKSWIGSINNALQSAFENRDTFPTTPSPGPSSTRKDIAAVLMGKSSSFSGHRQISNPNRQEAAKALGRHATIGSDKHGDVSVSNSNSISSESSVLLQRIRAADDANKVCADCGSDNKVDWCSINLGALLCIECSGIHRSLGTHISKVRSLTLDTAVFTADLVETLMQVGNRVSNAVWEAKLDRFLKPLPHSTREQRLHFITAKYSERTYVQGLVGSQTPDDHLLTSIKRNSIKDVVHALALRANPNAHDRSRSTHALYLALAAADPAAPAANAAFSHAHSPSTSSVRPLPSPGLSPIQVHASSRPSSRGASPMRKLFPMAELLLQNGADLPSEPAPFPLSQAAKQYLELKHDQRGGKISTPTAAIHSKDNTQGDTPPTTSHSYFLSHSSSSSSSQHGATAASSANTPLASLERLSRDRDRGERLVKRSSAARPVRPPFGADALETFVKK